MLHALLYSVFCLLLDALVDRQRSDASLRLELLVLGYRRIQRELLKLDVGYSHETCPVSPSRVGSFRAGGATQRERASAMLPGPCCTPSPTLSSASYWRS